MNKLLTAAIAATIAASSLGVASAAEAQSRGAIEQRQDIRDDRREFRQDNRNDRREYRQDIRDDRREVRQDRRAYGRYQQAQRRYNAARYQPPRGYHTRQWSYGQQLPTYYRSNQYVVSNYGQYGLRAPPRGYQYVRSGNDVVLAAVAGGLITAVIAGLFN